MKYEVITLSLLSSLCLNTPTHAAQPRHFHHHPIISHNIIDKSDPYCFGIEADGQKTYRWSEMPDICGPDHARRVRESYKYIYEQEHLPIVGDPWSTK
jgi:hypothetical protein